MLPWFGSVVFLHQKLLGRKERSCEGLVDAVYIGQWRVVSACEHGIARGR
jgi:hypothetical protein